MKLSELDKVLSEKEDIQTFLYSINPEVIEYKRNLLKKGTAVAVFVEEDIYPFYLSKGKIILLCRAFLKNMIDEYEFDCILHALAFVTFDKITDVEIEKVLDELTGLEPGGKDNFSIVGKTVFDLENH